ncbi:MAG: iron-containing alcohol dehydrogenase [Spirochaetales bacterium]|nr:iron-containing alcohol dehydrogenase [Spirochaetales bacterium]
MTDILKPAGTLLFGRAMLAQLAHEMDLLGVRNPVMITDKKHLKRARKAASMLASELSGGLKLTVASPSPDADFLILAGGKKVADEYAAEPRLRARIILGEAELGDFIEPETELTVLDSVFVRDGEAIRLFMKKFASSITSGLAGCPGRLSIPKAFSYSCGTTMFAGDDALSELPRLLAESGSLRPLVLTDKGIIAVGLFKTLSLALDGVDFEVFDNIPPDSDSRVVNEISRIYTEGNRDSIIAMGGGSVLDTGKGVFLNVSLGVDDLTTLAGSNRIPKLKTPFIAIPTTSGTGSEVTKVAVISDTERHRKILYVSSHLQPAFSILDSRLTASLPPHLTSITGMDALSHAVEAYTCLGKNPVSDQMAWTAITLIRDNLIPVISDPGNLKLRLNLALASNMAGQAFSNSMVGMVHTIGHSVGAVCHAPHGSCMSVFLPFALEYNYPEIQPLLAELLTAFVGEKQAASVPKKDRANEMIDCIRRMNRELKQLTGGRHPESLRDILGRDGEPLIRESHFLTIAEKSLGDASIIYNPVELRIPDILKVLADSY